MIDGFNKAYSDLVEARLADIYKSEEYTIMTDSIFIEFEQMLTSIVGDLDTETKNNLLEVFKSAVFHQTHHQNRSTYRMAFNDALNFFVDTFIVKSK